MAELLCDLRTHLPLDAEIILTLNVPEEEAFLEPFADLPLHVLRNDVQRGFGENHNRAFAASSGRLFAVINPDIRLTHSPFAALAEAVDRPSVGVAAPLVLSPKGTAEDSVRRFPSVPRLLRRIVLRNRRPDYLAGDGTDHLVEWAAGMFLLFTRKSFDAVRGFDTRYFMYFEDVDICRRLANQGRTVMFVPRAQVIHAAERASHRSLKHLRWHSRSALRFLFKV